MQKAETPRDVMSLSNEIARIRADSERLFDLFSGLALLFGTVGGLVLAVGASLQAPVFGFSAGFAFAAALAFALVARIVGTTVPARAALAQPT